MEWIIENWELVTQVVTGIVAVASAICAITDTPDDDAFLGKLYKILELFAINIGKAKQ